MVDGEDSRRKENVCRLVAYEQAIQCGAEVRPSDPQ